jgi:hypothetical protein
MPLLPGGWLSARAPTKSHFVSAAYDKLGFAGHAELAAFLASQLPGTRSGKRSVANY